VLLIPLVGVVVLSGRHWPQGTIGDSVFDCLGLALLLTAVGIRTWATFYVGGRKSKELVTTGPYSLCRHPLYLGSFLVGLAMAALLQSLTLAVVFLLLSPLMYAPVMREEERILELNHGQAFRDYKARVPRKVLPLSLRHLVWQRKQEVDMHAMRLHLARFTRAALLFPASEVIAHLQANGTLPVWFHLP
jgi:protein-S-isoprenylcysteine O-methyltransferase Ste14